VTTPPGPLAEEAARLVEAIAQWARDATGGGAMRGFGGSPECQLCPFCQVLALARRSQPETFGHLADASASLVAALRTVVVEHDHRSGGRASGVQHIDLDERENGAPDDLAPDDLGPAAPAPAADSPPPAADAAT
jgi:hypothetical protein